MRILRDTPEQLAKRAWRTVKYCHTHRKGHVYEVNLNTNIYFITFNTADPLSKGYGCTCAHGSMYGVNKHDELCKHIKLVREAIKQRGAFTWN